MEAYSNEITIEKENFKKGFFNKRENNEFEF